MKELPIHIGLPMTRLNFDHLMAHELDLQSIWFWHTRRVLRNWVWVRGRSRMFVAIKAGQGNSIWLGSFPICGRPYLGNPNGEEFDEIIDGDGSGPFNQPCLNIPIYVPGFVKLNPAESAGFWVRGGTYNVPGQEKAPAPAEEWLLPGKNTDIEEILL